MGETGVRPGLIGFPTCYGPNTAKPQEQLNLLLRDALTWDHYYLLLIVLVMAEAGL